MINLDEVIDFVIDETVFVIPVLSGKKAVELQALMEKFSNNKEDGEIVQKTKDIIKVGLSEIKNIKISGEIKESISNTEEIIEKFPLKLLTKVMTKIIEVNFPTEEEKKN